MESNRNPKIHHKYSTTLIPTHTIYIERENINHNYDTYFFQRFEQQTTNHQLLPLLFFFHDSYSSISSQSHSSIKISVYLLLSLSFFLLPFSLLLLPWISNQIHLPLLPILTSLMAILPNLLTMEPSPIPLSFLALIPSEVFIIDVHIPKLVSEYPTIWIFPPILLLDPPLKRSDPRMTSLTPTLTLINLVLPDLDLMLG